MRKNWIAQCLDSLCPNYNKCVPVVIDNCSTDDTVSFIKANYPETVLFTQKQNLGFGQGNNVGIKYALEQNADFVMLLNQDARLEQGTIQKLVDASDGESLLTPIHMNGEEIGIDYFFKCSIQLSENSLFDDYVLGVAKEKYKIGMFCAACWFMPIGLIRKIGGFNPLFFHYGEDDNYFNRIVFHNINAYVITAARMYHDRNMHGNKDLFNKRAIHRELLVVMTNINLTKVQKMYELWCVFLRHRRHPFATTFELIAMIFYLGKIKNSNNKEKKEGTTWL